MEKKRITFKYKGDLEDISAPVLLQSLLGFVSLIEQVNEELRTGKKLNIRISSTRRGSFLVDLNLLLDTLEKIKSLFNNLDAQTLEKITYTVGAILMVKKLLRGEEPKEIKDKGSKVVIISGDNNRIELDKTTYKIITKSERIDRAIKDTFEPIVEEDKVSGVEIEEIIGNERKELFQLSKSEIPYIIKTNPLLKEETRCLFFEKEELIVLKVVFARERKWEFIYKGEKISAYIEDDTFYENLKNRKYSFTVGTRLICDLEIVQVLDKELRVYINKEYIVKKVHEVLPPPQQPQLPLNY
ncbi:hypothetical protein Theam_0050 [Thermovibrio ammonificans HB-1]|uniref:Uncharacterized protein n=1 Tax=Thermovibrio ammonificans (strain DSM 15698 / JCM 12110 / HB-1) TaxID=648996 RepID=E8T319_THEA1|nr:hypothetical protein [Thermovibrio ammonificans]ADU96024.1 hypothetical protein Theam_0050 [Thermovibrio ammonificans HB-1]